MADKTTILIVDRERILLDVLVRVWSARDVTVLGSTSADEAIRLAQVRTPDLLIADPAMPHGFQLIETIRAGSRTKIIALSDSSEARTRAVKMGVARAVDRNRGLEFLVDAIQKVLSMRLRFMDTESSANVLIVDDDEGIRLLLADFLTSRGYEVSAVRSGDEAIARLNSDPAVRIVLLDIDMPGTTGMDVLYRIMGRNPHPAVIMITALVDRELAREALKVGASDYILKPFDFSAVEASIAACTGYRQEPWWKQLTSP